MTTIATFRSQFRFGFRWVSNFAIPSGIVFGLLLALLFGPNMRALMNNLDVVGDAIRTASLTGTILVLIGVGLVTKYFTIKVTDQGLHAYDFWGHYHDVVWDQMHSARSRNLLGLPYICVDFRGGTRALWIPRFLCDFDRFCSLVSEYAGEGHPLYRELIGRKVEDRP